EGSARRPREVNRRARFATRIVLGRFARHGAWSGRELEVPMRHAFLAFTALLATFGACAKGVVDGPSTSSDTPSAGPAPEPGGSADLGGGRGGAAPPPAPASASAARAAAPDGAAPAPSATASPFNPLTTLPCGISMCNPTTDYCLIAHAAFKCTPYPPECKDA